MRTAFLLSFTLLAFAPAHASEKAAPLVIGETFTLQSKALNETRRINVYLPPGYADSRDQRFPVLYMPDGGLAEDFLHVAGRVQVSVGNGTERLGAHSKLYKALWFCSSGEERGDGTERFAAAVQANARPGLQWRFEPMPQEKHSTIYQPAALRAFRAVFKP
jgi:predicted alpha/beta superfamily hydrolase